MEFVDKKVADELFMACEWALKNFMELAKQGKYPEFMKTENGGEGFMPLANAIKGYTNKEVAVKELPSIYEGKFNQERIDKHISLAQQHNVDGIIAMKIFNEGADFYKNIVLANEKN